LAESDLQNEANNGTFVAKDGSQPYINTPLAKVSLALPHDAVGHDNDSLGVFQQRAIDGNWAPVGPGEKPELADLGQVARWLMNPAYAAEAFFANPTGKQDPKSLMNVPNWDAMDPWLAAQAVQRSFDDTGSNYKARLESADIILEDLYDITNPIALPAPLNGKLPDPSTDCLGDASSLINLVVGDAEYPDSDNGRTVTKGTGYAWPKHMGDGYTLCMPNYAKAVYQHNIKGQYVGSPSDDGRDCLYRENGKTHSGLGGVDCGGFVTIAMKDSGLDPNYAADKKKWVSGGNTTDQYNYLASHPELYKNLGKIRGTGDIPAGAVAIAIKTKEMGVTGHTYMYLGKINNPKFKGNGASASQGSRSAMATNAYDFDQFVWFVPVGGSTETRGKPVAN